jgi:hypothetical protein
VRHGEYCLLALSSSLGHVCWGCANLHCWVHCATCILAALEVAHAAKCSKHLSAAPASSPELTTRKRVHVCVYVSAPAAPLSPAVYVSAHLQSIAYR